MGRHVEIGVSNVSAAADWYRDVLDMRIEQVSGQHDRAVVRYDDSGVSLVLTKATVAVEVYEITHKYYMRRICGERTCWQVGDWDGRHAIAMPEAALRDVYTRIELQVYLIGYSRSSHTDFWPILAHVPNNFLT